MTGDESADKSPCFFGDNTLETVEKDGVERESAVSGLLEDYNYRDYRFNARVKHLAVSMAAEGTCSFIPGKEKSLQAVLSVG